MLWVTWWVQCVPGVERVVGEGVVRDVEWYVSSVSPRVVEFRGCSYS